MSLATLQFPSGLFLRRGHLIGKAAFLFAALLFSLNALAQSDGEHQAYLQAVTRLTNPGESATLERFVSTAVSESLKRDGLEWLVTDHLRRGEMAAAKVFGQELLGREPENALGLAVSSNVLNQSAISTPDSNNAVSMAKRALRAMPQLKAPELMPESEFSRLRDKLARTLNGAVGYAYYQQSDYVSARAYLRKAVALAPENAQYAYALAICDLFGRDGDEAEGFRLLARTVNLTQGTPAGQELANFARLKYEARGGTSSDWDRYLAATRVPSSTVASSTPARAQQPKQPEGVAGTPGGTAPSKPSAKAPSSQSEVAFAGTKTDLPSGASDLPSFPRVKREIAPPGSAFSLGILIQTSQTSHEGRRAVINTLSDMVRHLRDGDEAFLVSFSKNVAFEEDLTGNAKLLEAAMDQIRPAPGASLFDAVSFAAGHLNRIARNRKRVLLVVSDGQNGTSQISPLELSGELRIGDVEIFCIGMNSNTREDQYRLQSLAAKTGGQALFVADASQFRSAANQVAANLGIGMR